MNCLTFASLTQRLQKLLKVLRGLHSPLARKIRNFFLHVDASSRRCISAHRLSSVSVRSFLR